MIKLYELRKEREISQDEIAKILNVTRQSYSRYERGEHELGYEALNKLANFFDVSIDYLLGYSIYFYPDKVRCAEPTGDTLTREERELVEGYRGLDDKLKKLVRDSIKVYSGDNELIFKPDKKV